MVVVIVGKTCSGKDAVAHYLEDKYKFKRIVTYTTRPVRSDDVQGVSHHFLTAEERALVDDSEIFSPTFIDGYEYFTKLEQFEGGDVVCILDPKGVDDLEAAGIPHVVIYVDCPEELILERAGSRGDDLGVVKSRLNSERERFDTYLKSGRQMAYLLNIVSKQEFIALVDTCMLAIASRFADKVDSSSPEKSFAGEPG